MMAFRTLTVRVLAPREWTRQDIEIGGIMGTSDAVVVYGATGHTGRFVVAELLARGFAPVVSGRDAARLEAPAGERGEAAVRPATVDDPGSMDRALAGAAAVVNCAGPFAVTGGPVVEAALRAGIPYVDVVVRTSGVERRATARGQDIYAVTAPLAVKAVRRILAGHTRTTGVASAGAMFDAADFLRALTPHLSVELP